MDRSSPPCTSDDGTFRLEVIGVDIMPSSPLLGAESQPGPALQRLDNKQGTSLSMPASPLFWGGSPARLCSLRVHPRDRSPRRAKTRPTDGEYAPALVTWSADQRASAQQPGRGPSPPPPQQQSRSQQLMWLNSRLESDDENDENRGRSVVCAATLAAGANEARGARRTSRS